MTKKKKTVWQHLCVNCGFVIDKETYAGVGGECPECEHPVVKSATIVLGSALKPRWNTINRRTVNGRFERSPSVANGIYKDVKVCDEWRISFKSFYKWSIANGFKLGLHLDRIDGNLHYSPDNCRWVTQKENNRNRSATVINEIIAKEILLLCDTYLISEIARVFNLPKTLIKNVINGSTWSELYNEYYLKNPKTRNNTTERLPIRTPVTPGTIDFNDKVLIRKIKEGYLALDKNVNYEIVDWEDNYVIYSNEDTRIYSRTVYFRLIEAMVKNDTVYTTVVNKWFKRNPSKIPVVTKILKQVIKDDIKDRYVMRLGRKAKVLLSTSKNKDL